MTDFQTTVDKLLALLTFPDAQLSITEAETEILVDLTVDESATGVLIGYHGEKIDALQLILSLIYNQNQTTFKPVRLDINDYRQRRTEALAELADKAVDQAVKSGREIILPPLSAAERRLVHVHLSKSDKVTTYSEGEGRTRRLIIRPNNPLTETNQPAT
jgi:spoIIIJ-associated protein